MLKVNVKQMVVDGASSKILDIIQWCHKNNRFGHPFGIVIYPPGEDRIRQEIYMSTVCAQLMNAVVAQWPQAEIINTGTY
jgi:hypothetical protein